MTDSVDESIQQSKLNRTPIEFSLSLSICSAYLLITKMILIALI